MGNSNIAAKKKPVRTHCKAGSALTGSYLKQERKVTTLRPEMEMMVIPYEIHSPLCIAKTNVAVRQSKSLEDREIGKQFARFGRNVEVLFPEGDDTGAFHFSLDTRSQVLSIKDRRHCVGKPVVKLALSGIGQLFTLVALDLHVPVFSGEVLQQVISQASTANV